MKHFLQSAVAIVIGLSYTSVPATAQQIQSVHARWADGFVDSIGINVHMSAANTVYGDYPKVKDALLNLGIRHLREGMDRAESPAYFANYNALGTLGIKTVFTTSLGQTPALWQAYPLLMSNTFEAYENPSEVDDQGDLNWLPELMGFMPELSAAVRGQKHSYPVYGPALVYTESNVLVGNVSELFDYGNQHNYPGGRNPETLGWGGLDPWGHKYGSMPWHLDWLDVDSPGLPWVTTETGYTNEKLLTKWVPYSVAATYMPRLALNNYYWGAKRTFIYELISGESDDYGLIDAHWHPKPAYYALANLLNLLSDPGPFFHTGSLEYGIAGGDGNLQQLLFQKRNGTFYLALWLAVPCYDIKLHQAIHVEPEFLNVQLPANMQVTRDRWAESGNVSKSVMTPDGLTHLSVNDKLTILEISPVN